MVNITPNAVYDISDYYYNVMSQHPNTWDVTDVMNQTDKVIDEIEREANSIISRMSTVKGQVLSPLLKSLQTNGMVEAYAKTVKWYFTLRFDSTDSTYYVDNAIKSENMSNRARRRGISNLTSPLSNDDRGMQKRMWEAKTSIPISESKLRRIIAESIRRVLYN